MVTTSKGHFMKKVIAVVIVLFILPWQSLLAEENIFYQQPVTPSALQWYNQAQQLEAEGRYAEAVSAYNVVIQTPDATQQTCIACTWAHRGLCLERLGDYGNAAHSYTHALQYGDIPFAREGLGRIQARMQPQQQPNYGYVPQQQSQPSYQAVPRLDRSSSPKLNRERCKQLLKESGDDMNIGEFEGTVYACGTYGFISDREYSFLKERLADRKKRLDDMFEDITRALTDE